MKKLFYNQILDKKGTKKILSWFLENYGPTRTSQFIEQLKSVGFHFATEAGLSLGFDDLKIPTKKSILLNTAESDVLDCEKRFFQGKITAVERYQKLIDIWTTASENLKDEVIQNFQNTDLLNPLYMMAFSGARGNISQVRQLVGMRGLMSDSAGGIIDFPIRSNFREGLTVTEYAISCYGARKGLIDTALRTADSGYLTRRLVDVAHGIMIGRLECTTKESFDISPLKASGKSGSEAILLSLEKRIIGRVLAEDISQGETGLGGGFTPKPLQKHLEGFQASFTPLEVPSRSESNAFLIARKNDEISPSLAQKIVQYKKETIRVRSPLTCLHFQNLREDICQLCYGWSLAHGRLVSIGEAVGILAAQSIGEPGTQLTMRTFHTGGIFSTDIDAKIFAPHNGVVSFSMKARGRKVRTFHGETAFFTFEPIQLKIRPLTKGRSTEDWGRSPQAQVLSSGLTPVELREVSTDNFADQTVSGLNESFSIFQLPAQSLIFVYPGQVVSKNILCAEVSQLMSAKKSSKKDFVTEKVGSPNPVSSRSGYPLSTTTGVEDKVSNLQNYGSSVIDPSQLKDEAQARSIGGLSRNEKKSRTFGADARLERGTAGALEISVNNDVLGRPIAEEENELQEESNNPNSKKVLSEIEGQIYFHRLAERRQMTEFEKLSHVKGVGSLWVLAGKKVFTHGPFQSGDFVTKKRHQQYQNPLHQASPLWSAGSTQLSQSFFDLSDLHFFKTSVAKNKIQYYRINLSKFQLAIQRVQPLEPGALAAGPLATGPFDTEKSFRAGAKPTPGPLGTGALDTGALGEPKGPVAEAPGIAPLSLNDLLQKPSFHSHWVKNQFQKDFPSSSIFSWVGRAFGPKPGFKNRIRTSKKFSVSFTNRQLLSQAKDFHQGVQFKSQQFSVRYVHKPAIFKIFSTPSPGYLMEISKSRNEQKSTKEKYFFFIGTCGIGTSKATTNLVTKSREASKAALQQSIGRRSVASLGSQISNLEFQHGELRFLQDLKKNKRVKQSFDELTNFLNGGTPSQKSDKGLSSAPQDLELGTSLPIFKSTPLLSLQEQNGFPLSWSHSHQIDVSKAIQGISFELSEPLIIGDDESHLQSVGGLRPSSLFGEDKLAGLESWSERFSKAKSRKKSVNGEKMKTSLQSLNLRTSDLRFYTISFPKKDCQSTLPENLNQSKSVFGGFTATQEVNLNPSEDPLNRKIGELVRVGDKIGPTSSTLEQSSKDTVAKSSTNTAPDVLEIGTKPPSPGLSIDKTIQIIRRTLRGGAASAKVGLRERNLFNSGYTQEIFYTLRRVHPYLISNHSPLAVSHGDIVEARQFLFELFYQQSKTGDIVQGLPKIEQLFEARRTSLHVIETVHVRLKEKFHELCHEYPLYEAARLSIRFIQRILIDEIQLVYQSQGVDIADKHIEIIIRQMTSKVIIHEKGKSPFFPDDIIDFHQIGQFESKLYESTHAGLAVSNPHNSVHSSAHLISTSQISSSGIVFEPIVLGLTKIAFLTQSFISAASFQETKRVLMNSALQSRVDFLYGLKENVIVGRFIRAGTGFRTSLFPSA
jgi:hypothetical protein